MKKDNITLDEIIIPDEGVESTSSNITAGKDPLLGSETEEPECKKEVTTDDEDEEVALLVECAVPGDAHVDLAACIRTGVKLVLNVQCAAPGIA